MLFRSSETDDNGVEYLFKIIVVGESGAGKTSIIQRYVKGQYTQHYKATIGLDFSIKKVQWTKDADVVLQLWDIAGQERYACLHRSFYKGAIGAIVVFDCTNQQSLEKAKVWKTDIDAKITWHGKKIPTILFANKSDLLTVPPPDFMKQSNIDQFCSENSFVGCVHTSAKQNTNIDKGIKELISAIMLLDDHRVTDEKEETTGDTIVLRHREKPQPMDTGCSC